MATTMVEKGLPTKIDFSKSFAIALIDGSSNKVDALKIEELTSDNNTLSISYSIKKVGAKSFSSRHHVLMVVDKKYANNKLYANYHSTEGDMMVGGDMDEFGCKPSTGYMWSIVKDNAFLFKKLMQHWKVKKEISV